jgi:hypothetical protein
MALMMAGAPAMSAVATPPIIASRAFEMPVGLSSSTDPDPTA